MIIMVGSFQSLNLCCLRLVEVVEEDGIVGLVDFERVEVLKILKYELSRNWEIVVLRVDELKCWDVR